MLDPAKMLAHRSSFDALPIRTMNALHARDADGDLAS